MTGRCLHAADKLLEKGIHVRVIELPTIKPLDTQLILQAAKETGVIITAEEHSMIGGLGGAVAEYLASIYPVPIHRIGIPDSFCPTGPDPDTLMDAMGLSAQQIEKTVEEALEQKPSSRSNK